MISGVIQVRTGSTRLPAKNKLSILGCSSLEIIIGRLKESVLLDQIIIATTSDASDDWIEELGLRLNVLVYRGSVDNVLNRVLCAGREFGVEIHVEIHGDNIMYHPIFIDALIGLYLKNNAPNTYITTATEKDLASGTFTTIYHHKTLEKIAAEKPLSSEHVSVNFYKNAKLEKINFKLYDQLKTSGLKFEIDEIEDYEFIQKIYSESNSRLIAMEIAQKMAIDNNLNQMNFHVKRRYNEFLD
jgi:spore coat polysaccharide biosynthesis protein SpsF